MHSACGRHLNAARWICSRGKHGGSFSPFFNITHMQQKWVGTLRDFRGETSSTLALNRLLSNLILVSEESSFLMWRTLTGSHAHFLCHLQSLEAEVKQKDTKTFIPGAGKQGDVSELHSAVNYNNFGNKLQSHPPILRVTVLTERSWQCWFASLLEPWQQHLPGRVSPNTVHVQWDMTACVSVGESLRGCDKPQHHVLLTAWERL